MSYPFENAMFNWEAGIEKLRDLERSGALRGDQVTVPVRLELRRRLGAAFWLHLQTASDFAGGRKSVF